jgi:8-oxo-dGTP pyrophosphatase MutT (NUDIX family)
LGDTRGIRRGRGEPRAAATREVNEEQGLDVRLADLLVLYWAPHPAEGDKLLVIFDGGQLDAEEAGNLVVADDELSAVEFFDADRLADLLPARLARRVIHAAGGHTDTYLEHGVAFEPDGDRPGQHARH